MKVYLGGFETLTFKDCDTSSFATEVHRNICVLAVCDSLTEKLLTRVPPLLFSSKTLS